MRPLRRGASIIRQYAQRRGAMVASCLLPVLAVTGCGKPSQANIELRKQNAALRQEIADLQRTQRELRLQIESLESQRPTMPTLPADRLEQLFVVHELRLGRLTGGSDIDPDRPGDEALRVVAVPVDGDGHTLKAAGRFVIEVFDLSDQPVLIGRWDLGFDQTRDRWMDGPLVTGYVLELPWLQAPRTSDLTLKVTFEDALTGRQFRQERSIRVQPPQAPAEASDQ